MPTAPAFSSAVINIAFGSDVEAMQTLLDKGEFPFAAKHWWSKTSPVFVALQNKKYDCFKLLAAHGGHTLREGMFKKSILMQAMEHARAQLSKPSGLESAEGAALLDALRFIIPLGQTPADTEHRDLVLFELARGHASSFSQSVLTPELLPYVSTQAAEDATMAYLQTGTKETRDPAFYAQLAPFCREQRPQACRPYDPIRQTSRDAVLTPFQFLLLNQHLAAIDAMAMAHPRPREAQEDLRQAGLLTQTLLFPRFLERLAALEREDLEQAVESDSTRLQAFAAACVSRVSPPTPRPFARRI